VPAEQSIRDGRLQDALTELQDQVRKDPSNPRFRVFLFQLLCVLGDWERARDQLKVLAEIDAGAVGRGPG
jgi:type VI secretion system protein ImpE